MLWPSLEGCLSPYHCSQTAIMTKALLCNSRLLRHSSLKNTVLPRCHPQINWSEYRAGSRPHYFLIQCITTILLVHLFVCATTPAYGERTTKINGKPQLMHNCLEIISLILMWCQWKWQWKNTIHLRKKRNVLKSYVQVQQKGWMIEILF